MSGPIEEFLGEVSRGIGEVNAGVLQEALAEMRGHLEESALGFEELGEGREEAERMAVLAFGNRSVAREAMQKRPSLFDHSIFPLGWVAALAAFVSVIVSIATYLPDSVGNTGLWLLLVCFGGMAFRGYSRKKMEWVRIPAVLAFGAVLGICALAPFMRASFGGGLDTVAEFESNRVANETHWRLAEARQDHDFEIMRAVLAGDGKDAVGATQTAKGYLLPVKASFSEGDPREYSPTLSVSVAAWKKEARRFDLDKRIEMTLQARGELWEETARMSRLDIIGNVAKLGVEALPVAGVLTGLLFFWQAVGLLTRMIAEFATRWVRARRGLG